MPCRQRRVVGAERDRRPDAQSPRQAQLDHVEVEQSGRLMLDGLGHAVGVGADNSGSFAGRSKPLASTPLIVPASARATVADEPRNPIGSRPGELLKLRRSPFFILKRCLREGCDRERRKVERFESNYTRESAKVIRPRCAPPSLPRNGPVQGRRIRRRPIGRTATRAPRPFPARRKQC